MDLQKQIQEMKQMLEINGYSEFSDLLELSTNQNKIFKLGIVGDYSAGKSTLINLLIDQKLLKPSVIPTDVIITIKEGMDNKIITEEGEEFLLDKIDDLIEENNRLNVSCTSEFIKGKEITEFPGLISKKVIEDVYSMKELYMCDATILVVSADHMLSEAECSFIENFSKYVNDRRLFVVINKLDLIEAEDRERVVSFASNKMKQMFPNVKWCFLQKDILNDTQEISIESVKKVIDQWSSEEKTLINEVSLNNIKAYIKEELSEELNKLKDLNSSNIEQENINIEKLSEEKQLEKIRLENVLLKFEGKKSQSLEKFDLYVKKSFKDIEKKIIQEYDISKDKYEWYQKILPNIFEQKLKKASVKADKYIINAISKDIEWLNDQSAVCTDKVLSVANLLNKQLEYNYQGKSYGKAKKYIPIGIGGSVIVGFCLFRIIGASVCLGGGLIFSYYLNYLDQLQSKEIEKSISSDISKVAIASRKMAYKEVSNIYDEIIHEYRNNIDKYLDQKYELVSKTEDISPRIAEIEKIIGLL